MNEKIKEFAFQAIKNPANPFPEKVVGDVHCFDDEELEEFVSLIIEECDKLCDTLGDEYHMHQKASIDFEDKNVYAEGAAASDRLKFKIRNHFRG